MGHCCQSKWGIIRGHPRAPSRGNPAPRFVQEDTSMRLALEDISIGNYEARFGPEQRFRWEESRRRVRAEFAGVMVADSRKAMLLLESGRLPVYYFPMVDVRMDLLEPTPHRTHSALKGDASYWMLRVGDRVAEKAAWGYSDPPRDGPPVRGYISFYWDKMDAWYEEEERVFGHARDPYHRVDILRSSRHVRIELGGVTIAETRRPRMLLETQLPVRYYIPE